MDIKHYKKPIVTSLVWAATAITILFLTGELRRTWSRATIYYLLLWVSVTIYSFYKNSRTPKATIEEPQQAK